MRRTATTEPTDAVTRMFDAGIQSIEGDLAELRGARQAHKRTLTESQPAGVSAPGGDPISGKRTITAAGREAIAAAQRKRWAAKRAGEAPAASRVRKKAAKPMQMAAGG